MGGRADENISFTKRRSDTVGGSPEVNWTHRSQRYRCSTAQKASWSISTLPIIFARFLPSFCFSNSFFFRVMSPPPTVCTTSHIKNRQ